MHPSSYTLMGEFIRKYLPRNITVLDVGGADVNGSYKPLVEANGCIYKTLDHSGADYVVKDYNWLDVPIFGAVISGQTLEHDPYFWKTLENISGCLIAPSWAFIIVPSKGKYHKHPIDCYRFYKDADKVFAEIMGMELIETVWNTDKNVYKQAPNLPEKYWGDLGMVFKK